MSEVYSLPLHPFFWGGGGQAWGKRKDDQLLPHDDRKKNNWEDKREVKEKTNLRAGSMVVDFCLYGYISYIETRLAEVVAESN